MFFALIFTTFCSHAQTTVWTKDPAVGRKVYTGKSVRFENGDEEAKRRREDGYLPPEQRDALFKRIGFESIVAKMDDLDKDLLVSSAHSSPISDLKKFYPKIKADDLTRLKAAVDQAVDP